MQLRHIETLLAIADAGSIRAAAERIGKSQPALTKRLRQMEEEIGLKVFLRTSKGMVLTDAGRSMLERARSIEAEISRMDQELAEIRGVQTGNIRVCVPPLVAAKLMPRAVSRFHATYPDVGVIVASDMYGGALNDLREGQHDILVGHFGIAPDLSGFEFEELLRSDIAFVTSKSAPHATATSLTDLTDCYWVTRGNETDMSQDRFRGLFSGLGMKTPKVRMSWESHMGILAMVRELNAVCTFPVRFLDEVLDTDDIVRIPLAEALPSIIVWMVTRSGQSLTPAGSLLADCIRHRAGVVRREWAEKDAAS